MAGLKEPARYTASFWMVFWFRITLTILTIPTARGQVRIMLVWEQHYG